MKLLRSFLCLSLIVLSVVGCSQDDNDGENVKTMAFAVADNAKTTSVDSIVVRLAAEKDDSVILDFTTLTDWKIPNSGHLYISQLAGKAGKNRIVVKTREYNCKNVENVSKFFIQSVTDAKSETGVLVIKSPLFEADSLHYTVANAGGTVQVRVKANAGLGKNVYLKVRGDNKFEDMLADASSQKKVGNIYPIAVSDSINGIYTFDVNINPNMGLENRKGCFCLLDGENGERHTDDIYIEQKGFEYEVDDNALDGIVTLLHKHSKGVGVPVVLVGDRFSKKQIKKGFYRKAMLNAVDALFTLHPMKALKEYFDVYEVVAVTLDKYPYASVTSAFNSQFSDKSTQIFGDYDKALVYGSKAYKSNHCCPDKLNEHTSNKFKIKYLQHFLNFWIEISIFKQC